MAFAMKLASEKAEVSACPYASRDAKQILGEAYEPPVKCITLGADELIRLGEETVLYRHEKTFVTQTLLAIHINDTYRQTPHREGRGRGIANTRGRYIKRE